MVEEEAVAGEAVPDRIRAAAAMATRPLLATWSCCGYFTGMVTITHFHSFIVVSHLLAKK
jgi:hypothetical protein